MKTTTSAPRLHRWLASLTLLAALFLLGGQSARASTWGGYLDGSWDTSSLNWTNNDGNPAVTLTTRR